jgi:fructokinase
MKHLPQQQIIGIGEVLWDMLPEGNVLGGAPANFVYNISQFGLPAKLVSAIGDDQLGRLAAETLAQRHIDTVMATVSRPTGTVEVKLADEGIPSYDIKEHAAWDFIPLDKKLLELARTTTVACFGSLAQRSQVSRDTINMFLDTMPDGHGRIKVFDINLRQGFFSKEIIEQSLTRCNMLKINDEELAEVSRMLGLPQSGTEEICRRLMSEYIIDCVILTCGTKGSHVFGRSSSSFLPTPEVKVADTVGAGDSFTAAFIASLLRGKSIREAHRRAVEVSAYVCSCPGAMNILPENLIK